jgi:hypothetical protein
MGVPFATADDVDVMRSLDSDERDRATVLLRYASAQIRKNLPDIDTRIASGALDPDLANLAAVQMVLRVLRNPDGVRQESVGPSAISYDNTQASGKVQFTADELALLAPAPTGTGVGAATARVGAGLGGGPGGIVNDRAAYRPRRPRVYPW